MRRKIAVGACCAALALVSGAAPAAGADAQAAGKAAKCEKLIIKYGKAYEKGNEKKMKKLEKKLIKANCQQSG